MEEEDRLFNELNEDDELDNEDEIEDLNLDLSEEEREDSMNDKDLMAEDHIAAETPKKSSKVVTGVIGVSVLAALGGAGYLYATGGLDSLLNGNSEYDDFEPAPQQPTEQLSVSKTNVEAEFAEFKKELKALKEENNKLKADKSAQNADMQEFNEKLKKLKSDKTLAAKAGISEKDIAKITKIVEDKALVKISGLETRMDAIQESVLKNEDTIKKTVKVSLNALKEARAARKETKENMQSLESQIESLQSFSKDIQSNKVEVTPDVINKLNKLEKQVEKLNKKPVVTEKKKVSIPIEVEIKDTASESTSVKTKKADVIYQKYYSMVGLFEDTIYLRDKEGTEEVFSYSVGDTLDGYGEIMSITKDGRVKTESGFVKYK